MKTLIIALYDTKILAKETIDELKDAGIKGSHIEHISSPGDDHKGIFKGLFSQQEKDQKDAKKSLNELTERGISESQARGYVNGVRQGLDLLIVDLNDDNLARSARAIMDRRAYSARPATTRPATTRPATTRPATTQPATTRPATTQPASTKAKTFETSEKLGSPHRSGIVESAESEGISTSSMRESSSSKASPPIPTATGSSTTPRSSKAIPHSDEVTSGTESSTHEPLYSGASKTSETSASRNDTSRFDSSFREHYQRNFADSRYSYEDFALAYRYGVALAEEPRYESHSWDQVEPMAHQSWETRETGPWHLFRDAIRFGWNRIRGEHQSEPLPPRL